LIEVASDHEGGDLVLTRDGHEFIWDLKTRQTHSEEETNKFILPKKADEPDSKRLRTEGKEKIESSVRWCIFYTDIEHQVKPVTSGHRMVLQFNVSCTRASDEVTAEEDEDDSHTSRYDYPDLIERSHPLSDSQICSMRLTTVEEISQLFKTEVSLYKCIGIPLYHLYTSLSIFPEYLKKIDSDLFSMFLKEGYSLILTPIELTTNRNEVEETGDLDDESIWIKWLDFPKKVYQWNHTTQQIDTKSMVEWPQSLKMTFVMNGMETGTLIFDENQQTGNEGPPPENHYLSGPLVIMKTPTA
jgi:hypothetical protein